MTRAQRFRSSPSPSAAAREAFAPRGGARLPACLLLAPVALSLSAPVFGQAAQPVPIGSQAVSAPGGAQSPLAPDDAARSERTDLIVGQDSRGPYRLSWKGFRPGSERVYRDGTRLKAASDYTIDPASGVLTLIAPLRAGQLARVTYQCDTKEAAPNQTLAVLPLQFDLWQKGGNRLALRSVTKLDPKSGDGAPDTLTALQFTSGTRFLRDSNLNTGVFLDLRGGNWFDRSGLKIGEQTRLRGGEFALAYTRAGADFKQEDSSGIKAGFEVMEASGSLTALRNVRLNLTARQTTQLLEDKEEGEERGATKRELLQNLAVNLPGGNGSVQAGRALTEIAPPDGKNVTQTSDSVRVERTLAPGTSASVGYEALRSEPQKEEDGAGSYAQKTSLNINSRPNKLVALTGKYENSLGTDGAQDALALRMEATPFARLRDLRVRAFWEDKLAAEGARRKREALIDLPTLRFGQTRLSGGVRQAGTPGKERQVGLIDGATQPLNWLKIVGGARFRDGEINGEADEEQVDSYNVKLALTPWRRLRLTSALIQNPESSDGTVKMLQTSAFGMETEFGNWALRGQYRIEDAYAAERMTRGLEVGLTVRLSRFDTLATEYQTSLSSGSDLSGSRGYALSYTRSLGALFDFSLSGAMTFYDENGLTQWDKTDIKASTKLSIRF